jgi:hypothetical protein
MQFSPLSTINFERSKLSSEMWRRVKRRFHPFFGKAFSVFNKNGNRIFFRNAAEFIPIALVSKKPLLTAVALRARNQAHLVIL